MPVLMGIDIETYSSAPLPKCGVYRYCDAPDFGILLFSYAFDDDPVKTIDLTSGETLPLEVISAMEDPSIIKVAYNAQFERVCLSRYLGHWLDPHQWRCTMVMAAYLTLPGRLADAAVALGTTEKMEEGKDLIRYFSVPCKPTKTNGGRTRNLPADAPEKWAVYKQYNAQDVETERAIHLHYDGEVIDLLAHDGYDPAYGARPLRRTIQRAVEDALSEEIIAPAGAERRARFGCCITDCCIGSKRHRPSRLQSAKQRFHRMAANSRYKDQLPRGAN